MEVRWSRDVTDGTFVLITVIIIITYFITVPVTKGSSLLLEIRST